MTTFGEIIKKRRKEKGLTLERVAKKAGTNKGYISGMECGKVNPPSIKVTARIAHVLGIDPGSLMLQGYVDKAPKEIRNLVRSRVGTIYV
jgi:transcriptional regulator with XRE-family HTH domain